MPDLLDQLIAIVERMTSAVPGSPERQRDEPASRAHELTLAAASQAGAAAGALALPPGPLGLLTVIPDLVAVWHIQRQLVADIASCYGKRAELHPETMMYCLFRHGTAQLARLVTQRVARRSVSRWLPIAGAIGVGAYAFYDTMRVGNTAQQVFASDATASFDASRTPRLADPYSSPPNPHPEPPSVH